jgi:hypothetical protein
MQARFPPLHRSREVGLVWRDQASGHDRATFECLRIAVRVDKELLEAENLVVPTENLILYDSDRLLRSPSRRPICGFFCGRYQARFQRHR